ncbi:uncharacterized protein LOC116005704 [Ipomoea triloba]|uniref:uncharacterized protein LOC116005704 n=1 Tax=Ipomoea triloba TaxID=35885 RepID=UPI00125E74DF|nr:uncharacterized protein LOC116005704 [Ipomoea triloba]
MNRLLLLRRNATLQEATGKTDAKTQSRRNLHNSLPNARMGLHDDLLLNGVCSSGQALGGHKRSHFADSVSAIVSPEACSASTSTPMNLEKQGLSRTGGALIDLNLPALMEDYNDDGLSTITYV